MDKVKRGFTLIELLVVIAIIGLLSTLSILALNTARARARDVKRVADVKQIQTSLEMYFNDMGVYPGSLVAGGSVTTTNGVYLKTVPKPPSVADGTCAANIPNYTYLYTPTTGLGGTYTLSYCLGSDVGDVGPGLHSATPAGIE